MIKIMALILGYSQVKYMHEYLQSDKIVTLYYPGFQIHEFMDMKIVTEMVPSFPVSINIYYSLQYHVRHNMVVFVELV